MFKWSIYKTILCYGHVRIFSHSSFRRACCRCSQFCVGCFTNASIYLNNFPMICGEWLKFHEKYVTNIIKWHLVNILLICIFFDNFLHAMCVRIVWMKFHIKSNYEISDHLFLCSCCFQVYFHMHWLSWVMIYSKKKKSLNRKSCTIHILHMMRSWRKCISMTGRIKPTKIFFIQCEHAISTCLYYNVMHRKTYAQ